MPLIDFDGVPDAEDFSPVPPGKYLSRVKFVEEKSETEWKLTFEVIEGEHSGRLLFDHIYFTEKSKPRIKLITSRMGIATDGKVDLQPHMFEGKNVYITTELDSYEGKERNKIPFAGYDKADQNEVAVPTGDDAPF